MVTSYIEYYHMRARGCKAAFYTTNIMKFLLLGLIPVLQVAKLFEGSSWVLTAITSGIVFIESIQELFRMKDKWVLYRDSCNKLLSLQRRFLGGGGTQSEEERKQYISDVERLIGEEAGLWLGMAKEEKKKENAEGGTGA